MLIGTKLHTYNAKKYYSRFLPKTLVLDCYGIPVLCERIARLRPDLLISGWIPTYGFYSAISGFHPHALLVWGSDILLLPKRSPLDLLKTAYALRVADLVIVNSEVQRNEATRYGCDPRKVLCLPWAVELDLFKPAVPQRKHPGKQTKYTILCARSHETVYGIEYLLRAIPLILSKVPLAQFVFAGSGSLSDSYHEFVRSSGLEKHVDFLGKIPHYRMPDVLSSCDVYVSPSLSDGSSATLLEAMACGKPCVASDIAGNREWVRHGVNGILVPPRDPGALADAVVMLLREPGTRASLGGKARLTVEQRADLKENLLLLEQNLAKLARRFRH
jgi:glycosyltransferase involved in cell wall biosynthesis